MKTNVIRPAVLALALSLAGCGSLLKSDYQRPALDLPSAWQGQGGVAVATGERWWRAFGDPQLDALIEGALLSNNDLAAAAIRVQRARLQAGLVDTNLTPDVAVDANGSAKKDVKHGGPSVRGYDASVAVSYEVDLWGRLARARDAAAWEAEATELDRQSTALTLVGTTAQLYWQIAELNQRIANADASLADIRRTLELVTVQHRAGAVGGLDETQAALNVANQQAERTELLRQRDAARNALAILFDQAPAHRMSELPYLPKTALPPVATGVPADVLSRRPDVAAAEWRLKRNLANVDATRADFYPKLTLTGSLGSADPKLTDLLSNPVGTLGAGLLLPFVQWNTLQLKVDISKSEYDESVVLFRQTLYKALTDVEDTLSAGTQLADRGEALQRAYALSLKAESIAEVRYRAGQTGVKDWIDQQRARRAAEDALAQNRRDSLDNRMKLYLALGGSDTVRAPD
ncbi:efflux transporter outer membrane subunit [Jeongeupia naejangsanensis]|uniref:efflux transporter outer membrane subunit n=1 Tax=Jeongeupia naejangsanensis TaxID=613195 RepID=UPI001EF03BAD|nr:efflux transporter outer membrane subunit [Jeongeupia naejangsanensis]